VWLTLPFSHVQALLDNRLGRLEGVGILSQHGVFGQRLGRFPGEVDGTTRVRWGGCVGHVAGMDARVIATDGVCSQNRMFAGHAFRTTSVTVSDNRQPVMRWR